MLPELHDNQSVFFEITNPVHGGTGWELGTTLWSPIYSSDGRTKAWKIMESIKPDDIVIHLVKLKDQFHWTGMSTASSTATELASEPPKAAQWSDMSPYQRVSLEKYTALSSPQPINEFFEKYQQDLLSKFKKGSFYVRYGKKRSLRVGQRYLAKCPSWLYSLFSGYSELFDYTPAFLNIFTHSPSANEPSHPDLSAPGRIETVVSRIIRDTKLSRSIKAKVEWRCQICGVRLLLPNGRFYAEGHHIVPLGGGHSGLDSEENIIILCPNHHTEFDYGCIAIDPVSLTVSHVDKTNQYHAKKIAYNRSDLSFYSLMYHNTHIFNGGNNDTSS